MGALAALELWIANQCLPDDCPSTWLDSPNGQGYGAADDTSTSITWSEMKDNDDPMSQPAVPYVWPNAGDGVYPGFTSTRSWAAWTWRRIMPSGKNTRRAMDILMITRTTTRCLRWETRLTMKRQSPNRPGPDVVSPRQLVPSDFSFVLRAFKAPCEVHWIRPLVGWILKLFARSTAEHAKSS